ncbi:MAG: aspartate kinase [Polyangiaceae bacterium]
MIVMKFGGSSVANRAQIEKVLSIVRGRAERRPLVVSSAHKGMTDALLNAARDARAGKLDENAVVERQARIARELGCADSLLAPLFDELRSLLRGIYLVRELSPRSLDYVASFGERFSVRVIADFFTRSGFAADAYDVWDLGFVTNNTFGSARPLADFRERALAAMAKLPAGRVPIVTGFVGKTLDGDITTVGRNGSDLTATLLGAAIGAEEVEIWSDTDGVMTADPSVVPSARNIPTMRFEEAAELAFFGSRVLHPATLLPAMEGNIPVRVLNTNRPEHRGTVISSRVATDAERVTSIAYKENQLVLNISAARMFGEAGFLGRVFEVCTRHGVVVDLVTTSEVTVSITADKREPLERAAQEISAMLDHAGEVRVLQNRSILAVVGHQLAERPGLGAEILSAIARVGVNIEMISYAFGAINLSLVVADQDVSRAVSVLHEVLFGKVVPS